MKTRIATATGAMLADPQSVGNLPPDAVESWFDPDYWRSRGELAAVHEGRGSAWFIASGARQWVLRHFRRGGFIARLSRDRYVWAGEDRVRAFAEWRLLQRMRLQGLPVPQPIAARYERGALSYRCDLITQRIAGADSLSAVLARQALPESQWRAVGAAVARLQCAGVDHADLNAHNLLLDGSGVISVIDFDRGRVRRPGAWGLDNLRRLQRSFEKISRAMPSDRYSARTWDCLMAGYEAESVSGAGAGNG